MERNWLLILVAALELVVPGRVTAQATRLDVRLVTDEADAVLAILDRRAAGAPIRDSDWQRLFESEGYRRLKLREASLQRAFEDSTFRTFVLSEALLERRAALHEALVKWATVDLRTAAERAFAYLPDHARIRVKVYPSIKPRTNTFVFETRTDPAIFYYLDPAVSPARFENTLIHEFHHIGVASACAEPAPGAPVGDPNIEAALRWIGGFAEGRAVLAAAGAPDVHPHVTSDPSERAVWERDVANVERDMRRLEEFFLALVAGTVAEEEQTRRGMSFVGTESVPQGPLYTVGYVVARTVESQLGRARLVQSTCDPRTSLADYNEAAARLNRTADTKLPLWSDTLLARLGSNRPGVR
jgi:hypothetical protein